MIDSDNNRIKALLTVIVLIFLFSSIGLITRIGLELTITIAINGQINQKEKLLTSLMLTQIMTAIITWLMIITRMANDKTSLKEINKEVDGKPLIVTIDSLAMSVTLTIIITTGVLVIASFFGQLTTDNRYMEMIATEEEQKTLIYYLLLILTTCVGAPLVEELIYRKVFIQMINRTEREKNYQTIVALSGYLFSLNHLPQDIINGNVVFIIIHAVGTFIFGCFAALVYIKTKSLVGPILMHGLQNSLIILPMINFWPLAIIVGGALVIYGLMMITKKYLLSKKITSTIIGIMITGIAILKENKYLLLLTLLLVVVIPVSGQLVIMAFINGELVLTKTTIKVSTLLYLGINVIVGTVTAIIIKQTSN